MLAAAPAVAQDGTGLEQDGQAWFQVNTHVPIAPRVRLTLEQIARFGDKFDGLYQTEFGGIIGYRVADGVELGFGYRRVGTHNRNTAANEHRIRQHIIVTRGPLMMRLRLDERFHPAGDEVGFRLRPLLRYNRTIAGTRLAPFVSHEGIFLPNSTRWGQRRGLERMRNIIGVAVPIVRGTAVDIGYLNQYRFARGGARAQMDHALTMQLTFDLGAGPVPPADD